LIIYYYFLGWFHQLLLLLFNLGDPQAKRALAAERAKSSKQSCGPVVGEALLIDFTM